MSENSMIGEALARLLAGEATRAVRDAAETGIFPSALWAALEAAGALHPSAAADLGGVGGSPADEAAVLMELGRWAAPGPAADTLLAGLVLARADIAIPPGPLVTVSYPRRESEGPASGTIERAPWGRAAAHVVIISNDTVRLVPRADITIAEGQALHGEPRDQVHVADAHVGGAPSPGAARFLMTRGALGRAALIAGALEAVLDMTVRYANDRVQFGRPISKFQAIQHTLAQMAGECAAAAMAVTAAYAAIRPEGDTPDLLAAVAKSRAGEAAGLVAAMAHQVHGAIGFTHEHDLQAYTRRLWTWRDEFGSETAWNLEIGRAVARAGADAHWPLVTGTIPGAARPG